MKMDAMPDPTPEALLLRRYADGDEEALDELVLAHQEQAFWVARHTVGNDELANDLVQDAFVRVLHKSDQYDETRPFKAWFLQIVRNLAIDHLRRRKAQTVQILAETASVDAETRVEQGELAANIQLVLDSLPPRYRELIVLRDVEGLGPDEIAVMMDADYGTTRWRIHQARKRFRMAWVERFGLDDLRPD